jgi:hypothetical protein
MDRWIFRDELAVLEELTEPPHETLEEAIQASMLHSDVKPGAKVQKRVVS